MNTLILFNHQPYDGTDVAWNGLRLADKLVDADMEVRVFLMNDSPCTQRRQGARWIL